MSADGTSGRARGMGKRPLAAAAAPEDRAPGPAIRHLSSGPTVGADNCDCEERPVLVALSRIEVACGGSRRPGTKSLWLLPSGSDQVGDSAVRRLPAAHMGQDWLSCKFVSGPRLLHWPFTRSGEFHSLCP